MAVEVSIKKDFGKFILDVEFHSRSRRIGILGASGSGKSLTLKSIAGIEKPDSGKITVSGRTFQDSRKGIFQRPQERRVGYLFQNYALFPAMNVEQNIAAGLTGKRRERQRKVREMTEKFQLQGLGKQLPGELSGGQQQRVALARMMVCEPDMILLDEPFSALDTYLKDQLQREFMEMMADYPGTLILVSHSRDEIYRLSEEVIVLENGKAAGQGETKRLFENPGNRAVARLTGCKNIMDMEPEEGGGLRIPGWDYSFVPAGHPAQNPDGIAIRAHQFCIEKPEEPCLAFPVLDPLITEDMFEYNIAFRPSAQAKERVNWKVFKDVWQKETGRMPRQIYLREKDVLYLRG